MVIKGLNDHDVRDLFSLNTNIKLYVRIIVSLNLKCKHSSTYVIISSLSDSVFPEFLFVKQYLPKPCTLDAYSVNNVNMAWIITYIDVMIRLSYFICYQHTSDVEAEKKIRCTLRLTESTFCLARLYLNTVISPNDVYVCYVLSMRPKQVWMSCIWVIRWLVGSIYSGLLET